jgi:hypothetical protein
MNTLRILQHSLGRDQYGQPNPANPDYRNYFVASPGHHDWATLLQAVTDGLMTRSKGNAISGGGDIFSVTEAGKAYIAEHSPKPPKLTRAQKRYQAWLDADCGLTFAEYNGWRCRAQKRRDDEDADWRKRVGLPPRAYGRGA